MTHQTETPLQQLQRRGIAQIAVSYGAREVWHNSRPAIGFHALPTQAERFKYGDGRKPKSGWTSGHKEKFGADIYVPQGDDPLIAAVAAAGGVIWIANGEPSLWSYHAAGVLNSICWYGEGSIPHNLVTRLREWGVTEVRNPADHDQAGRQSAKGVRSVLKDSGIRYLPLLWGENLKEGYDANDAWIDAKFDAARFADVLNSRKALILPSDELPPRRMPAAADSDRGMKRADAIAEIIGKAEANGRTKKSGDWVNFRCFFHDDHDASAGINTKTGAYKCFVCDSIPFEEVCERLGIDYHPYTPPEPPRSSSPLGRPHGQKPAQQDRAGQQAQNGTEPHPRITNADHILNTRFLPALPSENGVLAVASDTGTGKTTVSINEMAAAPTALYLCHRERLADNLSRTAERKRVAIENYKSLSQVDQRRAARMATCINTHAMHADSADGVPTAELVVIDEAAQLLDHVYGDAGTFEPGKALIAAETLKHVAKSADRVLVLDAHLDDTTTDYFKAIRSDVITVVNQHVADRGTLTMHDKRSSALAAGMKLVAANEGVVVFAVASVGGKFGAETIATDLIAQLGDTSKVLLLTANNAGDEKTAQREFLENPNEEIGRYRAVVYSPVIGTGYDITAPVRAVIGVMEKHLDGYEARQMIGRCRNTRETHVYLPKTGGELEDRADAIYRAELEKTRRTNRKLFVDGHIVADVSQQQLDYLYWHSRVMARRNWSINHLREHFVSLCAGYKVIDASGSDQALDERLKAIREAMDAQQKDMALTVSSVDPNLFKRLKEAGEVTPEIAAGHIRWKMENTVGATISPELRDQLWTSSQRAAVRNFTDLLDDPAIIKLADAKEASDGVTIPKRAHRIKRRNIIAAILNQLMDGDGNTFELDRDEFERRLQLVIAKYHGDLIYFGWRHDRIPTETASIVRGVLRARFAGSGVILHSEQRTVGGEKMRFYRLDQESLKALMQLAAARLAMLQQRRAENVESLNLNFAKEGKNHPIGNFKIAATAYPLGVYLDSLPPPLPAFEAVFGGVM